MRLVLKPLLGVLLLLVLAACTQQNLSPTFETLAGRPLMASLSGAAEAPGPGDPDGSGVAYLTLNQGRSQVCFVIEVADIATPTAAHIHVGEAGMPGGVVVNFDVAGNGLSGCVNADPAVIKAVRQSPAGYYVNVHNADFPPGAVRGQLSK